MQSSAGEPFLGTVPRRGGRAFAACHSRGAPSHRPEPPDQNPRAERQGRRGRVGAPRPAGAPPSGLDRQWVFTWGKRRVPGRQPSVGAGSTRQAGPRVSVSPGGRVPRLGSGRLRILVQSAASQPEGGRVGAVISQRPCVHMCITRGHRQGGGRGRGGLEGPLGGKGADAVLSTTKT